MLLVVPLLFCAGAGRSCLLVVLPVLPRPPPPSLPLPLFACRPAFLFARFLRRSAATSTNVLLLFCLLSSWTFRGVTHPFHFHGRCYFSSLCLREKNVGFNHFANAYSFVFCTLSSVPLFAQNRESYGASRRVGPAMRRYLRRSAFSRKSLCDPFGSGWMD